MTTLVLGTGLGTAIVVAVWAAALLLCFISARTQCHLGPVAVLSAVIITLALVLIPRGSASPIATLKVHQFYDSFYVWRVLLVLFLGLSAAAGFTFYFVTHVTEQKHARSIKGWKM